MSRRRIILAACAVVLLTCIAYFPVLNGKAGYIWDDSRHVTLNTALSRWAGPDRHVGVGAAGGV